MELETNFKEDDHTSPPPILLSDDHLKSEIEDDFPIDICSSKGVFQDLHHLDNFSLTGSSLNHHEYGIQAASYDPFDPFLYGSNSSDDLDLYEFKPFELENGGVNGSPGMIMQNFQGGGGYLNNPNKSPVVVDPGYMTHMMDLDCPAQDIKPVNFFVPDEGSCVTADNGYNKEGGGMKRNNMGTRKPCKPKKKTNSSKGQWTKEEDRILIHLVEKFGIRKWSYIAQMLKGRIGKQCRERWHNHLRPDIKKDFWTEDEDRILINAHAEVGNKWSEIAKRLPGRTENSIKNHWNATKRRQYTRRKCRSKWPRPSPILQNYIKSLNLQDGGPKSKSAPTPQRISKLPTSPSTNDFCSSDRLVPDYDFNEVPEFALDEKLLQSGDSIDSLLEDKGTFDVEISSYDHLPALLMQGEVKKELDLMEMISQVSL